MEYLRKPYTEQLTAAEIARCLWIDRHEVSRRLPELRAAGLVTNPGKRKCRVLGNVSLTWSAK
jgi:CRP-like cAMP-binding protein